jgi:hypothetical protein
MNSIMMQGWEGDIPVRKDSEDILLALPAEDK